MSEGTYVLIYFGISLFIGWPVAARLLLESFASVGDRIGNGDRAMAALIGLLACSFWPLMMAVLPMYLIMKTPLFRTRPERERLELERRDAERAELEQLRRAVREHKIKGGELL